ncbi:hypothetical protein HDV05_008596, partial [Chytridiales sp. JEL 0842]
MKSVVVKVSLTGTFTKEKWALEKLKPHPSIPEILETGNCFYYGRQASYIILKPVGELLELPKHGPRVCLVAMRDALSAIQHASSCQILHRDISYGNVVTVNGRGYLIDWNVSQAMGDADDGVLVGTNDFLSYELDLDYTFDRIHISSETMRRRVGHDIESWFYVLLYISLEERLPWRNIRKDHARACIKAGCVGPLWERVLGKVAVEGMKEALHRCHSIIFENGKLSANPDVNRLLQALDEVISKQPFMPVESDEMYILRFVLCLRDCTTNTSNCGLLADGKPMIIDFRIENQFGGYFKSDILAKFTEGNGEFNYKGLMATAMHRVPQREKLEIMKESLDEWRLLENISKTEAEVNSFISKMGGMVAIERNDLQ